MKVKKRNKAIKIWFGRFPGEAQPMDLCVTKEPGGSNIMYYMVYANTFFDAPLEKKFVCLCPVKEKDRIEKSIGVRFPKGF